MISLCKADYLQLKKRVKKGNNNWVIFLDDIARIQVLWMIYGFPHLYEINNTVYRSKLKEQVLQPAEDDKLR